ncbi:hypothetical protein BCO18175_03614 [Burkholderia contaminans]|nr:hypothetical protein BCO18175_03614 [Burkholderia contaminans]
MGAQPREGRERLSGVQLGCYGVGRIGFMPCYAWLSAIPDFMLRVLALPRVRSPKVNRLMIVWVGTNWGRSVGAVNPTVYKQN